MKMTDRHVLYMAYIATGFWLLRAPAFAQSIEGGGSRASGMGGAFVAVASDSSAIWWNPAGLAAGPFVDAALTHATTETRGVLPVFRDSITGLSIGTPVFGFGYYRFRVTDIGPLDPTGDGREIRQERRAGVPIRSLDASQIGLALVQTVGRGIHAGITLKFMRGGVATGRADSLHSAGTLLDEGSALRGGDNESEFDVDAGVLAVSGPFRLGALMRHLLEPEFGLGDEVVRLPKQLRVGAAYDASAAGGAPYVLSVDADVNRVKTTTGDRRTIALGAERWLHDKRFGVRGGARVDTAGRKDRAATFGASIAVRAGLVVEGQAVRGSANGERGWGLAARVSF